MSYTRRRRSSNNGNNNSSKSRQQHRHRPSSSWTTDDVGSLVANRDSSRDDGSDRRRHYSSRHAFASNNVNSSSRQRMEPTIATTMSDLLWIIYGYTRHFCRIVTRYSSKLFRTWAIVLLFAAAIFATAMGILFLRFMYIEVIPLCTPPSPLELSVPLTSGSGTGTGTTTEHRPLVEYYVHGRGNGHYARSVAIVEQLLSKGIDVRMFIGRATMWRAINEAAGASGSASASASASASGGHQEQPQQQQQEFHKKEENIAEDDGEGESEATYPKRGQLTVTSVASLLPTVSLLDSISLALERVLNDCEVAKTTNRYPLLVISDGDLPGMWRARFGSIPSVSVSHGQTFVIGQVPAWVTKDKVLSNAWAKQRILNSRTSKGADWLIATNFVDIPVIGGNGVVARSPIRPEVVRMGQERYQRKQKSIGYMDESGNVLKGMGKNQHKRIVEKSFMDQWQKETINELLFGKDVAKSIKVVKDAIQAKQINPPFVLADNGEDMKLIRRKLVICYFRDKNGDLLTNALLRSGFDVLLFERGYHKGLSDHDEEKKLGQDLIVRQSRKKRSIVKDHKDADKEDDSSLRDHWVHILQQHNKHLLDDSRSSTTGIQEERRDKINKDSRGKDTLEKYEDHTNIQGQTESNDDKSHVPTIQEAVETVKALLKSTVDDPRIIRVTDMSLFVPLLSIADGVASSAGSQLLSECIYSHLNVLALYRQDDHEQMLNIEFSKHRFDHYLFKDETNELLKDTNHANADIQLDNVIHGMSLEDFAEIFETIARHATTTTTNTHHGHHDAINKRETVLITESEEATILRTSELKQTYNEFKKYITAVRHSPISWSYYHDVAHGILAPQNTSSLLDDDTNSNHHDHNHDHDHDNSSSTPADDHISNNIKPFQDAFQGMPDAAGVIIEILEDLIKNTHTNNHRQ